MHITNEHRKLSIAPMMEYTHSWGRQFLRLFAPNILIYGEMVHSMALTHNPDNPYFVDLVGHDHPTAFQLGGNDGDSLALSAKIITDKGFDEINYNCGCPSDRVQNGAFGAVLMKNAPLVAQNMAIMAKHTHLPLSVKCRINLDKNQDDEFLNKFIETIIENSPVRIFHIHARNAVLKGLSPAQNRQIPPLNYQRVLRLLQQFPQCHFTINGGFTTAESIHEYQQLCGGVMVGRAAFANPYILNQNINFTQLIPLIYEFLCNIDPQYHHKINPLLMVLPQGRAGAKQYRQILAQYRGGDLRPLWRLAVDKMGI